MDLGFPPLISTGSRRNGWPLLWKIEAAQEKKSDREKDRGPRPGGSLVLRKTAPSFSAEIVTQQFSAVLILVAVDAEILPIGAIRGIIPGIAILVVHR